MQYLIPALSTQHYWHSGTTENCLNATPSTEHCWHSVTVNMHCLNATPTTVLPTGMTDMHCLKETPNTECYQHLVTVNMHCPSATYTHARMHAHTHACMHARTHACTHARTHTLHIFNLSNPPDQQKHFLANKKTSTCKYYWACLHCWIFPTESRYT